MKRISFNYYELRLAVALEGGGGNLQRINFIGFGDMFMHKSEGLFYSVCYVNYFPWLSNNYNFKNGDRFSVPKTFNNFNVFYKFVLARSIFTNKNGCKTP